MTEQEAPERELKTERVAMMMTASELAAIDDWRFENRLGSRAKAMRILIERAIQTGVKP